MRLFGLPTEEATEMVLDEEGGLLVRIPGSCCPCAEIQVTRRSEGTEKLIVVILPDGRERYLPAELF